MVERKAVRGELVLSGGLMTTQALRPWSREMFQVARCIGRKDFAAAIEILASSLIGGPDDVYALHLLAQCHRWSGSEAKAIDTANQILRYDGNDFSALKLLAMLYANRDDPDNAAGFARRALENYPEPIKPVSRRLIALTKGLARIFPRLREAANDFAVLENPNANVQEWFAWAKEYLAWYDTNCGGSSAPVLH